MLRKDARSLIQENYFKAITEMNTTNEINFLLSTNHLGIHKFQGVCVYECFYCKKLPTLLTWKTAKRTYYSLECFSGEKCNFKKDNPELKTKMHKTVEEAIEQWNGFYPIA